MKKIINLIVMLGAVCGFTACDLEITPDTSIAGKDAAHLKYVSGLRNGIYNSMTGMTSYVYMRYPEFYTDLFNETRNSGNRGAFFSNWSIYSTDQDVNTLWSSYYTVIATINYTLEKCDLAIALEPDNEKELNLYKGELYFFRGYLLHQLALRFCEDYEPAEAESQLGVPCPTEYLPGAQLPRGTLAQTYARILEDVKAAEELVDVQGAQNAVYVTVDAITAFKAQVALQMHEYADAISYATSLYAKYPLAQNKSAIEDMWLKDSSTETIMQFDLTKNTVSVVGSLCYDYTYGSWSATNGYFTFSPAYVPEQWVCDLYSQNDYRYGTYVTPSHTVSITELGILMTKFLGNENLRTAPTTLGYANMPKPFRIAEMYMIEAEAQYRQGGDAAGPLNTLRASRGLGAVTTTGDALFADIKNECVREFIGEGRRLFDLKRWHDGFKRDGQTLFLSLLAGGTSTYQMRVEANNPKFVWPIPQYEMQNNPNIGEQNPGYGE